MAYEAELELAVAAAKAAGARLAEWIRRPKTILSEVGRDIKLQADRDAEAIIIDHLSPSGHPLLAEESGEHGAADRDGPVWVVDPLDGTLNFSRGIPICCTSIALCVGVRPVAGVIYDFNRGELITGLAGAGARANGEPMRVSDMVETGRAILSTGFPTAADYDDAAVFDFVRQVQRFKKLRLLGSAALMLAYVAAGRYEAYAENDIMWWDIAAGVALVEAAGGYVDVQPSPQGKWARRVRAASHPGIWE